MENEKHHCKLSRSDIERARQLTIFRLTVWLGNLRVSKLPLTVRYQTPVLRFSPGSRRHAAHGLMAIARGVTRPGALCKLLSGVCRWHCETLTLFKREITKIWYPVQEYSFWFGTLFKTGPQISVECFEHDAMLRHDCLMFWRARARTWTRLEVQGINTLFKTQTRELYTLFKTGIPENHTLSSGTSPYRKYRGVSPPPVTRPAYFSSNVLVQI